MKTLLSISTLLITLYTSFGQTPSTATQTIQYVQETSRPESKIEKKFPFDIALKDAAGKEFVSTKVMQKNGKPSIVMFWLTTCGPCRMELEAIKGKYASWAKEAKFNFYAISTDWSENAGKFADRVQRENWPFTAYHDINREFKYVMPGGLNGLPQVFVFDKDGTIVYHKRKYIPGDEDTLFDEIKKLQ
jgi:cytochrome c biogenesis protein CcmG/thiol:disulfide interchange protein DsbE